MQISGAITRNRHGVSLMEPLRGLLWLAALVALFGNGSLMAAEPAPFYTDKTRLLVYLDPSGQEHRIGTPQAWQVRLGHILSNMQLVMGPMPGDDRRVSLDVRIVEECRTSDFVRRKITFAVEPGDRASGYLFLPYPVEDKHPAVLCLHQTTRLGSAEPAGLGGSENLHYAEELARRGYVTLAVDYPNFGDYRFDPYQNGYASATMKGIWNHMRSVDLLMSIQRVDANRIGVIGHSLGGHNSLYAAAMDRRIRCVVSNCGFCSFPYYYEGRLAGWSHRGYMPRIAEVYDLRPEKMPFDFTEVVAALAPRPFLAIAPKHDHNFAVDGVKECIAAALPVYELFGAGDRLAAYYPDIGHDFPPKSRERAYGWLDQWLKQPHARPAARAVKQSEPALP